MDKQTCLAAAISEKAPATHTAQKLLRSAEHTQVPAARLRTASTTTGHTVSHAQHSMHGLEHKCKHSMWNNQQQHQRVRSSKQPHAGACCRQVTQQTPGLPLHSLPSNMRTGGTACTSAAHASLRTCLHKAACCHMHRNFAAQKLCKDGCAGHCIGPALVSLHAHKLVQHRNAQRQTVLATAQDKYWVLCTQALCTAQAALARCAGH